MSRPVKGNKVWSLEMFVECGVSQSNLNAEAIVQHSSTDSASLPRGKIKMLNPIGY